MYLIDANVLITAQNAYYAFDIVPQFWEFLVNNGNAGRIKIPDENLHEVLDFKTEDSEKKKLIDWLKIAEHKSALLLDEELIADNVQKVLNNGYSPDLDEIQLDKLGKDPLLIAYALKDKGQRIVVSLEVSRPNRAPRNRKIPDACERLGIKCINTFTMLRELNFSIG